MDRVNDRLIEMKAIKKRMTSEEIWSVTDIHVENLPFSTGKGISIKSMAEKLPEYNLVNSRSYGFFGPLKASFPQSTSLKSSNISTPGKRWPERFRGVDQKIMKAAFLTPEYPHEKTGTSGGIGTSIRNLAKGLAAQGQQVSILIYGQQNDEHFTDGGIEIYRIRNSRLKGLATLLTQKKIQRLINRLFREGKIDIVEAPDWTGMTSFIKPDCPLVLRLHGSDAYFCHLESRPAKLLNFFREKRAFQKADAIVSVSRFTAEMTNKIFALNRKFTVIPNCIDTSAFKGPASKNATDILYFGTLIRKKGMLELPAIFNIVHQKNNEARLVLVGKDSYDIKTGNVSTWNLMKPLFDQSALANVDYRGQFDWSEIKSIIENASVCVFPTFAEALPVSWLEAMAMGKPVVASEIGWAREIITDGKDGFLANPNNHQAFASNILRLLSDQDLRSETGRNARARIESRFSLNQIAAENISFYQSIIKNEP